MTVAERVQRGANILDLNRPGWDTGIDLETLDLCSTKDCVLGQVFGSYNAGLALLDIGDRLGEESLDKQISMGFEGAPTNVPFARDYSALDAGWRDLIEGRRTA